MTPLELAADLEAKHKALVEAIETADNSHPIIDAQRVLYAAFFDNLPTLLTALRESGEAIERAAKVFDGRSPDTFIKASHVAELIRALKPEPSR